MAKAAASPMADEATRAKWRRPTLNKGGISVPIPELPKGFEGCSKFKAFENSSFAESQDLEAVLKDWGVPTDDWGTGGTKKVCKFWDELVGNESGLEVWQKENGEQFLVRVTHVLRGKVSSPELYKRGMFLINTWQQFEDGRKRVRNGLLSEKLTIDEMPLEQNLHEVCERAVTEEEMQRVEDSICKIGPGSPAPTYDASYKCPLQVVSEKFIDHIIEIEKSKSYPGLLTVYHLYTVDIVCTGMPKTDFNTLEFTHADKNGERKLKYIHAWVWLPWTQIQRYLFEGSKLKESKAVNSFATDDELQSWLGRFFIPLDEWGTRSWKSVSVLHDELQSGSCHLECWGKEDGVPLVVRVAHVLQVKITSPELKHVGKFLFQTWHQSSGSSEQVIRNRPMSRIMSTADIYNNEKCFIDAAQAAVKKNIDYIADVHFRLDHLQSMGRNTFERADVKVLSASLVDHRTDLQESASFKDLTTMYHIYTVEVECEGLPNADFTTVNFLEDGTPTKACGWRWASWHQILDMLHEQVRFLEKKDGIRKKTLSNAEEVTKQTLGEILAAVERMDQASQGQNPDVTTCAALARRLQASIDELMSADKLHGDECTLVPKASMLPPSMLAKLEEQKLVSDEVLDECRLRSPVYNRTPSMSSTAHIEEPPSVGPEAKVLKLFKEIDFTNSGTITLPDLVSMFKVIDASISEEDIKAVWDAASGKHAGSISYDEFVKSVMVSSGRK
eukprot:TRINITY_DN869_c0_g1_i1.p1 TRINITY_DN869_c0_g1~~TRINITY_DN869_c0_g1_i1.p1  ORF type:complete len:747 (+),score=103.21 TRINITY_DN869_c0_g1_i1:57-2243(+)